MRVLSFAILAASVFVPAQAEVVSAGSNGFHIRHVVDLSVSQEQAFQRFTQAGSWWDDEHTYSGKASNMRLAAEPGGCFCESLPGGGGIEHMRVAYVDPGTRLVMTGSLGPLLYEATSAVMDVKFSPHGGGTRVIMDYKASGFASSGADKMAPLVDQVLGTQMKRYGDAAAR